MNITERKQSTIEHLRGLSDGSIEVGGLLHHGICFNLRISRGLNYYFVEDHCSEWEEFSGLTDYPVPSPLGAEEAYELTKNLWEGDYGASRKRLCLFLVDVLENMTDDEFEGYCL